MKRLKYHFKTNFGSMGYPLEELGVEAFFPQFIFADCFVVGGFGLMNMISEGLDADSGLDRGF
jgi:hypothetical protein